MNTTRSPSTFKPRESLQVRSRIRAGICACMRDVGRGNGHGDSCDGTDA